MFVVERERLNFRTQVNYGALTDIVFEIMGLMCVPQPKYLKAIWPMKLESITIIKEINLSHNKDNTP